MASRKQHFNLLLIVGLSLYSLPVVGSEFSYGDFEEVSQETAQTTKAFSEVVTDNPAYAIVPTIALLGGTAFLKRKSIQDFCKKKYESLAEGIYKDMINTKVQVDNQIDNKVPGIIQKSAKTVFLWALGPVTNSIENYWEYNSFHVYTATFFGLIGWLSNHSIVGGGIGGITLAMGYLNQGYSILNKTLQRIELQATKNKEALELQATKNKEELSLEIKGVSNKISVLQDKMNEVKTSIEHKIDKSDEKFEIKLSGLSKEIEALTGICVSLTGKFDKLHKDNVVRDEKSNQLINQLEKASADLLSAKKDFSSLSNSLIGQMTSFTEKTEHQLKNFTHNATEQLASMESKVEAQIEVTSGIKKEVSQLLGKVSESHELITVLQTAQIEGNQKIINLNTLVKEISLQNSLQSKLVEKIAIQQEQSMTQFTTSVSLLEVAQSKLQKSFDGFFDKFEKMTLELKQLKKEQLRLKKESEELKDRLSQNQEEMRKGFSTLHQEINKSKQYFDESFGKAAQNVSKHQEKIKEELLCEMRAGFSARQQIGMDHSFVPIQPMSSIGGISKKRDYYLPWDPSRPQLVSTEQVLAGVLGVALKQQGRGVPHK